jgi:hypothetical protein
MYFPSPPSKTTLFFQENQLAPLTMDFFQLLTQIIDKIIDKG